jgi:hypothetical protein
LAQAQRSTEDRVEEQTQVMERGFKSLRALLDAPRKIDLFTYEAEG